MLKQTLSYNLYEKKLLKEYQKIKKEYEDHKRQKQQQDLMGFT